MDSVPQDTKRCSKCGKELPRSAFSKEKRAKDGFQSRCKACAAAASATWFAEHPGYHPLWANANRDKTRKAGLASYYRHREAGIAYSVAYKKAHREAVQSRERLWRQANKKNIEYWRKRRAAKLKVLSLRFTPVQLAAKVAYWGNRCWVCAGSVEAIDHYKPLTKGGPHVLANLRPICQSCNSRKHNSWPFDPATIR